MIFEARPEKKKIFNLKNDKSLDFWRLYFLTKQPKENLILYVMIQSINWKLKKN